MLPISNNEVALNPPFEVSLNELENNFSTFFNLNNLFLNNLSIKEREGIEFVVEYEKINSNV